MSRGYSLRDEFMTVTMTDGIRVPLLRMTPLRDHRRLPRDWQAPSPTQRYATDGRPLRCLAPSHSDGYFRQTFSTC